MLEPSATDQNQNQGEEMGAGLVTLQKPYIPIRLLVGLLRGPKYYASPLVLHPTRGTILPDC